MTKRPTSHFCHPQIAKIPGVICANSNQISDYTVDNRKEKVRKPQMWDIKAFGTKWKLEAHLRDSPRESFCVLLFSAFSLH